jgi:hypothetical protein
MSGHNVIRVEPTTEQKTFVLEILGRAAEARVEDMPAPTMSFAEVKAIADGGVPPYVAQVARWLHAAGYRVAEQFAEGVGALEYPDYVIRLDLDGPIADVIWDSLCWKVIVHQSAHSCADDELSQVLTEQADAPAARLVRLARPVLDETIRRFGRR